MYLDGRLLAGQRSQFPILNASPEMAQMRLIAHFLAVVGVYVAE